MVLYIIVHNPIPSMHSNAYDYNSFAIFLFFIISTKSSILNFPMAVSSIVSAENGWTPLHFAAAYQSHYKENCVDGDTDLEEEYHGRYTGIQFDDSNKRAVEYLIQHCRVNVCWFNESFVSIV